MLEMDRFTSSSSTDIEKFIANSKNQNTERATNKWMNVYKEWAKLRGKEENIEVLPPHELDIILQSFFAELKKKNGSDYEPNSLNSAQTSIDRYLKNKGYKISILRDREFLTSRSVLEGKARMLREQGMGKRPNKAESLTAEEEEILWNCGQLGCQNPKSLINTLWWLLTQHFGLRGRQEHHSMKIEDFVLKKSDEGKEYLTFAEGITKTRQSGLHEKHRLSIPKMFETKTERCPITFFKFFLCKRPAEIQHTGPFYLAINYHYSSNNAWYKKAPMGENTINIIMKNMIQNSPLVNTLKKLTNHSARKTLVKKLKKRQVPKSDIITITGHNSEAGLDAYDSGDEHHQEALSLAIDGVQPPQQCSRFQIPPTDPRIAVPTFRFFDNRSPNSANTIVTNHFSQHAVSSPNPCPQFSSAAPIFHFHAGCNVTINSGPSSSTKPHPASPKQAKRRRLVIYSDSESSQEQY